jgi:hypothetical protein
LLLSRFHRIQPTPDLLGRVPGQSLRSRNGIKRLQNLQLRTKSSELRKKTVRNELVTQSRPTERISLSLPTHRAILLPPSENWLNEEKRAEPPVGMKCGIAEDSPAS